MRVIAGTLGSQRIDAPSGSATRPTSDRVREALFAVLGDVAGASVLDLYAGSGALGIEALSRGAARATFVEARSAAQSTVRNNLSRLRLTDRSELVPLRVERALKAVLKRAPYTLVFADPPWSDYPRAAEIIWALVGSPGVLAPDARVVVEHPARTELRLPPALEVLDERTWGDTGVTLLRVKSPKNP